MQEKKLSTKVILAIVIGILAILAVILTVILMNKNKLTAMVMRMIRQEGEVALLDASGQDVVIMDNMKLYSGNALRTGGDGLVDLSLDDTKYLTIENQSNVVFEKSGKALELKLNSGRLFFNVTEKLADDETMDISTSTMVVGIRGTSGWVDAENSDLYIGDGTLHVTGINPKTGEIIEAEFTAGQKVHVYLLDDQGKTVAFELENYTIQDVPYEMLRNIVQYPALFERFVEEAGFEPKEVIREAIIQKILKDDMVLPEEYEGLVDEVLEEMKEAEEEEEVEEEETEEVAEEVPETTPPRRNQQQQEETPPADTTPVQQAAAPTSTTSNDETTGDETTGDETTDDETTEEETTPTEYSITVSQVEGGSASASASSAEEGTAITLTATADYGYEFSGWSVSEGGISVADNAFTMPAANVTVAPQFTALPTKTATVRWYWSTTGDNHWGTASISSAGGGTVTTADASEGNYYASATITAVVGDTITAAVSPLDGYVFSEWREVSGADIDQQTAPAEFVMPDEDVALTAWFVPSDPVTFAVQYEGNDVGLPDGFRMTYGNGTSYESGVYITCNKGDVLVFSTPDGYIIAQSDYIPAGCSLSQDQTKFTVDTGTYDPEESIMLTILTP